MKGFDTRENKNNRKPWHDNGVNHSNLLAVPLSGISQNIKDVGRGFMEPAGGIQEPRMNVHLKWMSFVLFVFFSVLKIKKSLSLAPPPLP